ncbi:cytochrome P450 [Exophiala viscosa]|uniref:Cytochrome P450 n=1 Tax=Exophiala viscosa TaxID=2486360 RepID=A0AAN6DVW2_9EURO|nr:cytochrome P450 [Exophiala viscosa]KAI1623359.1 cytochrome P450 [Exophiala viscosa]
MLAFDNLHFGGGLAILFVVAILPLVGRALLKPKTKYRYPAGPNGSPLFGNLFQVPPKYAGPKFAEWGNQYGDMFTIRLGARRWVFLNSMQTVRELLDRRGRLYIGRPEFPITQDILSGGNRIIMMSYTERWRNLRKIMHQLLMSSNSDIYKPFQDMESRALLWQYLKSPEDYYQHGARFANSVIFSVVFGRRTSMRDENVRLLFSTIDDFMETQASPSTSLPEQFPWLIKIIPRRLQWFRPKAERVFKKTIGVYASFLDDLDKRIRQGQDPKCFARDMTDLATKYGFDDAQKYFCAGSIIEAGSDTTRNQLNIMLAAAAKFPAWVATAQTQLDAVCGDAKRLPTMDDWAQLPYIVAIIKESLRWRPNMTATGTPRTLIEDDIYGDYKFEKGTIFSYNNFGICHNEDEFTNNEKFLPERFLNDDLQDMLKGHLGFGAGRRICPGWHLGTRNMFIAFSRLLYCFNFKEVPGAPINENEIDPLAHDHPPFQIEIVPRSHNHVELVERECAEAGQAV